MCDTCNHPVTSETATHEQYVASSNIRFGRLKNYIEEKLIVDKFAVQGNLKVAEGLRKYVQENLEELQKTPKIQILDVGPAIGAISSMLALQVLDEFDLLEKAQVHLQDVSMNVIEQTQRCNFFYPESLLRPDLKAKIFQKLRQSKFEISSAEKIPWKNNHFNIVLACFLFHHLHDSIKPLAAKEMSRVLKPNGFLGIAEEWFENYHEYSQAHQNDPIPLAFESIIDYKHLSKMVPDLKIFFSEYSGKNNSYAFCGSKVKPHQR